MLDIGFWELVVIAVLALIVIGPERLPEVARKVGYWTGRARRFVASVRSEIERELRTEELERMLNEQNKQIQELRGMLNETRHFTEQTLEETGYLVKARPDQPADKAPRQDDPPPRLSETRDTEEPSAAPAAAPREHG